MVTFYGRCSRCGANMWADVETSPGTMLGPTITLVCKRHIPVREAQGRHAGSMNEALREQWEHARRTEAGPGA